MHREDLRKSRTVLNLDNGRRSLSARKERGSLISSDPLDSRLAVDREGLQALFVSAPSQSSRSLRYKNYFYLATPGCLAPPRSGEATEPSALLRDLLFPQIVPQGYAATLEAAAIEEPAQRVGHSDSLWYEFIKRTLDVALSFVLILLLSPLLLLAGIAVKLSSRGPMLYVHERVGKDGDPFTCFKFRTMVNDAEQRKAEIAHLNVHSDSRTFKVHKDPRVTRIGFWMRRLSIDELPQLFNVLLGKMSLVGPRPPLPSEVRLYTRHDWLRMQVKPGITCIWQVSGRSRIAFPEQVELDIEYIESRSLSLDLRLLARTIPAVLGLDGAY